MSEFVLVSAALVLVALSAGLVLGYLAFLRKAGPNEVIVVSGRGPVRFITGIGWPRLLLMASTNERTLMSAAPPAAQGTTTVTGRSG